MRWHGPGKQLLLSVYLVCQVIILSPAHNAEDIDSGRVTGSS